MFRLDQGKVASTRVDHNGNLLVTGHLTRTGVFTYKHRDGHTTRELRHPNDVFDPAAVASFIQVPVTDDHPTKGRVTPDNVRRLSVGNLGDTISREDSLVVADMVIRDVSAIEKIDGGKCQLSCGYTADVIPEVGNFNGEHYDHRQTNIRGNHVAIVDQGRAGNARLLLDDEDAEIEDTWLEDGSGEGSRGGKIVGHTKSGKPVYESARHPQHQEFSKSEHLEAKKFHDQKAKDAWNAAKDFSSVSAHRNDPSTKEGNKHSEQASHHNFLAHNILATSKSGQPIHKGGSDFNKHLSPQSHKEAANIHKKGLNKAIAEHSKSKSSESLKTLVSTHATIESHTKAAGSVSKSSTNAKGDTVKIIKDAITIGDYKVDAITLEVEDSDEEAVQQVFKQRDDALTALKTSHADVERLTGERDALKETAVITPERLDSLARERAEVLEVADGAGLKREDTAPLSNADIQRKVVMARWPDTKADASDDYIQGRFDVVQSDQAQETKNKSKMAILGQAGRKTDAGDKLDDEDMTPRQKLALHRDDIHLKGQEQAPA